MRTQGLDAIAAVLQRDLVGRRIAAVQVVAPNALKTLTAPDSLVGRQVTSVAEVGGFLLVRCPPYELRIDLQRAASLAQVAPLAGLWKFGDGAAPTVRFLTTEGPGFDLLEPSKTKRIGLWIQEQAGT